MAFKLSKLSSALPVFLLLLLLLHAFVSPYAGRALAEEDDAQPEKAAADPDYRGGYGYRGYGGYGGRGFGGYGGYGRGGYGGYGRGGYGGYGGYGGGH